MPPSMMEAFSGVAIPVARSMWAALPGIGDIRPGAAALCSGTTTCWISVDTGAGPPILVVRTESLFSRVAERATLGSLVSVLPAEVFAHGVSVTVPLKKPAEHPRRKRPARTI